MEKSIELNSVSVALDGILAPYGSLDQLGLVAKVGAGGGKGPPPAPVISALAPKGPVLKGPDLG